jgi:hypothetical protein
MICSVSQKLAAAPSLSKPLVINLRPGLLLSLLEINAKSILFDIFLMATKPKIQGVRKGAYILSLKSTSNL